MAINILKKEDNKHLRPTGLSPFYVNILSKMFCFFLLVQPTMNFFVMDCFSFGQFMDLNCLSVVGLVF
jgi:hypothetical protein